jgi:hypothetical protein
VKRGLIVVAAIALVSAGIAGAAGGFRVFPSPPVDGMLSGVGFVSPTDGWVVGAHPSNAPDDGGAATLTEHWNGSAWSAVPTPSIAVTRASLVGVAALASNNAWAVGATITGTLVEHWNGSAWSVVPSPNRNGTATHTVA